MNWALAQELESCQQQVLLYVIGDSADPSGMTRHCDPDYMARKARLSRATMFRRLSELEDLGLLARRKYYTEEGAPRYEIRLNLDARVNIPIRTRKAGDDDSGGEGGHDGETDATETPKSHAETLVGTESHGPETTKVSAVRQTQSHSCDSLSPTLSKSLPPNPPPGGSLSKREGEETQKRQALWDRFVAVYPGIARMDQQAAREELDALSFDDAEWAVSVVPQLKEELAKPKAPPPKGAHLWLRKAMFKNFPRARIEPPPPDEVWIADGSDEDRALRFVRSLAKAVSPMVRTRADGTRGYPHKAAVEPDLLAMLAFVGDVALRWPAYARGTANGEAWQGRFIKWIGAPLPVDAGTGAIRAPCPWPPKKDGTIYRDDDPPSPDGFGETGNEGETA